jgi:hypothetical protein
MANLQRENQKLKCTSGTGFFFDISGKGFKHLK